MNQHAFQVSERVRDVPYKKAKTLTRAIEARTHGDIGRTGGLSPERPCEGSTARLATTCVVADLVEPTIVQNPFGDVDMLDTAWSAAKRHWQAELPRFLLQ